MAGNMSVSMTLRLVDELTGPIRNVTSELQRLKTAAEGINVDRGAQTGAWREESVSIRGVTAQLGTLREAMHAAATPAPIEQTIRQFNEERNAIRGVASQLDGLKSAMAASVSTGPIEAATAKLKEQRTTIEGVASAMRDLGAASEKAAQASAQATRRRPSDPIDYGPGPGEPGGPAPYRPRLRPGQGSASSVLDAYNQWRAGRGSGTIAEFEAWRREQEGGERPQPAPRPPVPVPSPVPGGGGGGAGGLIDGAVGFAEATAGVKLIRGSIDEGASAQSLDTSMRAAGYSDDEITRIDRIGAEMSRRRLAFSRNSIVGKMQDLRAVLGSVDHAEEALPTMLDLATIVEAKHKGEGDEGVGTLVKGLEAGGATNNIADFNRTANTIAKVLNVDGATIHLADFGQFYKRAGAAGAGLSQDFIGEDLPHILQEMGGDATGTMINTLMRSTVGLRMDKTAQRTMETFNLLDPSQVDEKGHLKPGAFKQADLMRSNPYLYANQVLKPALEAANLSDTEEDQVLTQMFGNRNAARAMSIFMRQRETIERNAINQRKAKGLDAAPLYADSDPSLTSKAVGAQVENVERLAGSTVMPTIMAVQRGLAGGIGTIAEVLSRTPGGAAAAGAGVVGTAGLLGVLSAKTLTQGSAALLRTLGFGGAGEAAGGAAAAGSAGTAAGAAAPIMTEAAAAATGTTIGAAAAASFIVAGAGIMAGTIYELKQSNDKLQSNGRRQPRSQHDTDRPGHYVTGRLGLRNWVENTEEFGPAMPPGMSVRSSAGPRTSFAREPMSASPMPPASGPVTNNNQQTITVNAPVTINATLTNTTPGAIGGAVKNGIASAVRGAARNALGHRAASTAVLHDGYETR